MILCDLGVTDLGESRAQEAATKVAEFLLKTRAGHCEHFATATTMLLRAAGVPTRYAVGYSVQEKKGDQCVSHMGTRFAATDTNSGVTTWLTGPTPVIVDGCTEEILGTDPQHPVHL